MSHGVLNRPCEKVGVGIFCFDEQNYLTTVNYLSGHFEIVRLPSNKVCDIVYCLKQQFARHGIPEIVLSANSPFGPLEFQNFAQKYEFSYQTSSTRYPQSNGKVENAVKTAKTLMTKAREAHNDPFLALLHGRNTPSEQLHLSSAQILYRRRTRSKLPLSQTLLSTPTTKATRDAQATAKQRQAVYYGARTKEKSPLSEGQTVRVKIGDSSNWRKGEVAKCLPFRSYDVKFDDGRPAGELPNT